ncbi:MAG: DUF1566 domain-containing protein [Terracidiphilus sp.]|jgi:hypothetical protein
MRRSKFAGWALAAALTVAALTACAQEEGPILLPKPKPVAKPAGPTLLVTCDLACNWKLDGKLRGPIVAGDSATASVSLGQHVVVAVTTDGLDKMEKKLDIVAAKPTLVRIDLTPVRDARLKTEQEAKAEQDARDKAQQEAQVRAAQVEAAGTWTDPATGLIWMKKDNGIDVDWHQATDYCQNLRLAGYSNWRLPTIDELAGIYEKTQDDDHWNNKGRIKTSGFIWSRNQGEYSGSMASFSFGLGKQYSWYSSTAGTRALCVRHSGG